MADEYFLGGNSIGQILYDCFFIQRHLKKHKANRFMKATQIRAWFQYLHQVVPVEWFCGFSF